MRAWRTESWGTILRITLASYAPPGNLPGFEVTAKANKQIRHFWFQNDCLTKSSLPHQEVNSKALTCENIPKKLILHCFRRPQKITLSRSSVEDSNQSESTR